MKKTNPNKDLINTEILNNSTFIDFLQRLRQVAISQFEWINLPSSMNAEYLEQCLYDFGKSAFLYTEDYGFINSKCSDNGNLNIYHLPSKLNCYAVDSLSEDRKLYNGFKSETDTNETYCVLVKNNPDMIPTEPSLRLFAYRLYEAERTTDVNIKAQKTPIMIIGDESMKLALKNLYLKYTGNEPVIYADKKQLGADSIRAISTKAEFLADKLMEYKKEIWNEALTYLGINNINVEKKERLVSDEAGANNEMINLNLQARLSVRKQACKQFNELFGLTDENAIDVRVRSDLNNMIKKYDSIASDYLEKEGDDDE